MAFNTRVSTNVVQIQIRICIWIHVRLVWPVASNLSNTIKVLKDGLYLIKKALTLWWTIQYLILYITGNVRMQGIFVNFVRFAKISCTWILPQYSRALYLTASFYAMTFSPKPPLGILQANFLMSKITKISCHDIFPVLQYLFFYRVCRTYGCYYFSTWEPCCLVSLICWYRHTTQNLFNKNS